ncbi:PREDICTED: pickpocket protein 28-like [Bactrocera latifrons]|uniref:pickpocket protein 28-like n=1 Tax=Bactrocera latifrons TaxID=174628 RepID=UPI0008DE65B8|nr:PREDICTED: pickpocket protein 28-like [Bactrocera latifrons]
MKLICKHKVNATIANSITNWNSLNDFIKEISQPCRDMLLGCYFGGVKYNCEDIFHAIITDSGLCCVFNMVHSDFLLKKPVPCVNCKNAKPNGTVYVDWTPEKGYPANLPESYIPMPSAGTGESLGLSVTLDVEADYYYCSSENSVGFKMLLHNPLELPDMREIGLLLSPGRETKVRIKAVKTESEKHLRSMNKKNRLCFFEDEYNLKNYKVYTQRNCELECFMNMLLAYCGCVTHYAPTAFANQTVCSIYELSCVNRVQQQSMVDKNGNGCPEICWPSCYDLSYLPDFFTTPLAHARFQNSNQFSKNMSSIYMEKNIAVVNVYFKESWYRSSKQNEYIGITDFLSSVGGIIGLFFGFSFISLAEVIYYFVLKPARIIIVAAATKRKMLRNKKKLNKLALFANASTDKHTCSLTESQIQQTLIEDIVNIDKSSNFEDDENVLKDLPDGEYSEKYDILMQPIALEPE